MIIFFEVWIDGEEWTTGRGVPNEADAFTSWQITPEISLTHDFAETMHFEPHVRYSFMTDDSVVRYSDGRWHGLPAIEYADYTDYGFALGSSTFEHNWMPRVSRQDGSLTGWSVKGEMNWHF